MKLLKLMGFLWMQIIAICVVLSTGYIFSESNIELGTMIYFLYYLMYFPILLFLVEILKIFTYLIKKYPTGKILEVSKK